MAILALKMMLCYNCCGSAIENPGVVGMASKATFRDGVNQILNRENYAKGVVVHQKDSGVAVDVYLVHSTVLNCPRFQNQFKVK